MSEASKGRVRNLTLIAHGMRVSRRENASVLDTAALSAEILTGASLTESGSHDRASTALYVVIEGDGLIEEDDGSAVVVTAGDVVFVPEDARHRFVQVSRKFRVWRLLPRIEGTEAAQAASEL